MFFDMLEDYKLETKHYVILTVLGVVEFVLFALMFYNCILECRQKRRQQRYQIENDRRKSKDEERAKPTVMEIFSVDMTLNRDKDIRHHHNHHATNNLAIPHTNDYYKPYKAHRQPLRTNSL